MAEKAELVEQKIASTDLTNLSVEQISIISKTVAKDCNPTELAYFLAVAKEHKLSPFKKEIWCYKDYKNNIVIFAGRDGFLSIACKNPLYDGVYSQAVYKNDKFEGDLNKPDSIVHQVSSFDRGELMGAYAIVRMKGQEPMMKIVDFKEYKRESPTWKAYPAAMICKVAESHALRISCGITGVSAGEEEIKQIASLAEIACSITDCATMEDLEEIATRNKLRISQSLELTKELAEAKERLNKNQ